MGESRAICGAFAPKAKGKDGSYFNSERGQHDSRDYGLCPIDERLPHDGSASSRRAVV
jgi:hypothetical protein